MRSAILFILLCGCAVAQDSGISGVVRDSVSHLPMAGVHVTITQLTDEGALSSELYGAISGSDGRFSIVPMRPQRYFVAAKRNGYVYSPKIAPRIVLKPGEALRDFTIELTPLAVISGTVLDEDGEPVRNIRVRAAPVEGGSSAKMSASDTTDERGRFRMTGSPGKYYVSGGVRRQFRRVHLRHYFLPRSREQERGSGG